MNNREQFAAKMAEQVATRKQEEIRRSTDLLAKLLAKENLTIVDGGVDTSCIDTVKRIVHIVKFKASSPLSHKAVRVTSIAHEVGHALFTPRRLMHDNVEKSYPGLHQFINIVEDIRIEKLIRNKYKGLHAIMQEGRKIMLDNGVYGALAIKDPSKLEFINQLIIYTKVGKGNSKITLDTRDEYVLRYIERTAVDEKSVVKCAKFLYEYCNFRAENPFDEMFELMFGEDEEGDGNGFSIDVELGADPKEGGDNGEPNTADGEENTEEEGEGKGGDGKEESNTPDENAEQESKEKAVSEMMKELMERAEALDPTDIENPKTDLEAEMKERLRTEVDLKSKTSTLRKDEFTKNVIKKYKPMVTFKKPA